MLIDKDRNVSSGDSAGLVTNNINPLTAVPVNGTSLAADAPRVSRARIAVIGGGLAGVCSIAGLVRAAIDGRCKSLHITLIERGPEAATGLAYATDQPDEFTLNHDVLDMGSANVRLRRADKTDFYRWVQRNRFSLVSKYPGFDLRLKRAFVPRSMFGCYLIARLDETIRYAQRHGITVVVRRAEVSDVRPAGRSFVVVCGDQSEVYDTVVLATGNWSGKHGAEFDATGRSFAGHQWKDYLRNDAIPAGAVMLVSGLGLTAVDAALAGLASQKFAKVILSSRSGVPRRVRGRTASYERKFFTIQNLTRMAGEEQPFRLDHLLVALGAELRRAYGRPITLNELVSPRDPLAQLRDEVAIVERDDELVWRSVLMSMPDSERQEIYSRLSGADRSLFFSRFQSVLLSFWAPMPLAKAKLLLQFVDSGKLEIVAGASSYGHDAASAKFELGYTDSRNGEHAKHPLKADVLVFARGVGRDISQVPLYRKLVANGLAELHPDGGVRVCLETRRVIAQGVAQKQVYAIGTMACGETILTHNSTTIAQLGVELGQRIVKSFLRQARMRPRDVDAVATNPEQDYSR